MCVLPLHHERVLLLHGEMRVDLDGVVFILQLQQLLSAFIRHQLGIINDICTKKENNIIKVSSLQLDLNIPQGFLALTVTRRAAFSVDSKLA